MLIINARNVHAALRNGLQDLTAAGLYSESRNGRVLMFTEPVTTVYNKPLERVVFWSERDANPFFHFAESLWMLAGRNDVAFVANFAKQMLEYSDDTETLNGAYGYRWRYHFGFDQVTQIISALENNPRDRRQVLQMWQPSDLLDQSSKSDVPCNTQAFFSVNYWGKVDMTVCNRSNDMIWGAYGANAVHFSYLLEFVAGALGRPVGRYWQVSNNLHAYENELLERVKPIMNGATEDPYDLLGVSHQPVGLYGKDGMDYQEWLNQCEVFVDNPWHIPLGMCLFFRRVAHPIFLAHKIYKECGKDPRRFDQASKVLLSCIDSAWVQAGLEWLERRQRTVAKRNGDTNEQTGS